METFDSALPSNNEHSSQPPTATATLYPGSVVSAVPAVSAEDRATAKAGEEPAVPAISAATNVVAATPIPAVPAASATPNVVTVTPNLATPVVSATPNVVTVPPAPVTSAVTSTPAVAVSDSASDVPIATPSAEIPVVSPASEVPVVAPPPDVAALVVPLASALVDAVTSVASAANAANVANISNIAMTNAAPASIVTTNVAPVATVNSNVANANVANTNVANANVANTNVANANVANANVANANVANAYGGNTRGGNTSVNSIVNAPISGAGIPAQVPSALPKAPIQVVDVYGDSPKGAPQEQSHDNRLQRRYGHAHAWKFPVALACILLGIMVGLQYRTQASKSDIQIDDRRKLVELVRTMESERNKMSAELKETRTRMSELETSFGAREQVSRQLQDQLVRSRIEAGLTGMKGPGVVISMNDSPRTAPATEDNYFYIVHDVDLTALVNELWAAGAEAVSVNEQRIVTRSSIRCVGPAVLVNGVRLTAPYVTKAIGSKDLETALRMPGGFLNSMAPLISKGGEVKVNTLQEVVVPPYEGTNSFRYGQSFEKSVEDEAKEAASAGESGKSSGSLWH